MFAIHPRPALLSVRALLRRLPLELRADRLHLSRAPVLSVPQAPAPETDLGCRPAGTWRRDAVQSQQATTNRQMIAYNHSFSPRNKKLIESPVEYQRQIYHVSMNKMNNNLLLLTLFIDSITIRAPRDSQVDQRRNRMHRFTLRRIPPITVFEGAFTGARISDRSIG